MSTSFLQDGEERMRMNNRIRGPGVGVRTLNEAVLECEATIRYLLKRQQFGTDSSFGGARVSTLNPLLCQGFKLNTEFEVIEPKIKPIEVVIKPKIEVVNETVDEVIQPKIEQIDVVNETVDECSELGDDQTGNKVSVGETLVDILVGDKVDCGENKGTDESQRVRKEGVKEDVEMTEGSNLKENEGELGGIDNEGVTIKSSCVDVVDKTTVVEENGKVIENGEFPEKEDWLFVGRSDLKPYQKQAMTECEKGVDAEEAEKIEPLLSFKDVPSSERMNLFISKLSLCCVVFDFTDPTKSVSEKDLKRATLVELVEFLESTNPPFKFAEPAILAVCKMCSMNLFRAFPPSFRRGGSAHVRRGGSAHVSESDDVPTPSFDSAWPHHLHLVYDLLLKFVTCASLEAEVAKKYINHSFILGLLDLFDSQDARERHILTAILLRIYGKFWVHRPFIRRSISHVFYQFVYETEKHNGIGDLLEIVERVITRFSLPLEEEHKMFLWRTLMPLHKPKSLGVYLQQLTFCVMQFIEKDPKLRIGVVSLILKYWPITNSQRELLLIQELEKMLKGIHMNEFQEIMVPLFARIGCCIRSSHFKVAETALCLSKNHQIVDLIFHNLDVIFPIILPALESNVQSHWNHGVRNLSEHVRKMFLKMEDHSCDSDDEDSDDGDEDSDDGDEDSDMGIITFLFHGYNKLIQLLAILVASIWTLCYVRIPGFLLRQPE